MKKLWPVEDSEGFGQHRTGQVDLGVNLGARSTRRSTRESTSPMGVNYSVELPLTGRPGRPVSVQNTFLKPRDDF